MTTKPQKNFTPYLKAVYDQVEAYRNKHKCSQTKAFIDLQVSQTAYHQAKKFVEKGVPVVKTLPMGARKVEKGEVPKVVHRRKKKSKKRALVPASTKKQRFRVDTPTRAETQLHTLKLELDGRVENNTGNLEVILMRGSPQQIAEFLSRYKH